MNTRLHTIGHTISLLVFLVVGNNLAGIAQTEAAPNREYNTNYHQSRRSQTCREAKAEIGVYEDNLLADAPRAVKKHVASARRLIMFSEFIRNYCYDESDHEEVVMAAMPDLLKARKRDPDNVYVAFLMGVVHFESHQIDSAAHYFNFCYARKRDWDAKFHYYYGRVLHQADNFAEALRHYNWARAKSMPYDNLDNELRLRVAQSEFGLATRMQPTEVKVQNLGPTINTQFGEYASAVSGDNRTLYFTMRGPGPLCEQGQRRTKRKRNPQKDFISVFLEQVYRTDRASAENAWNCPAAMPKPINRRWHDNATCATTYTGDTLFIYQRRYYRGFRQSPDRGMVYMAMLEQGENVAPTAQAAPPAPPAPAPAPERNASRSGSKAGQWSGLVGLTELNSNEQENDFAISPDGQFAVFSSDREGGAGGFDLYIAMRGENGAFTNIQNLGRNVNTSADERAPFIDWDNRTLYFASDGHNSVGGFDIFITRREGNQWVRPLNMGAPVNSAEDDVFFHLLPDGRNGYLTSSRAGGFGYMDLYSVAAPEPEDLDLPEKYIEEIATLRVSFQGARGNQLDPRGLVLDPKAQTAMVEEAVAVATDANDFEAIRDKVQTIGNVNFGFDQSTLTPYSTNRLQTLVLPAINANPTRKVVLLGHTDPFGDADYNIRLSRARVERVRKYLVDNGVPATMIDIYYHGEDRLLLVNNNNRDANVVNRRVEIFLY